MNPTSKKTRRPKLKMLGPLCNQRINLETDAKTLNYSLLKLKYSPSIYLKHKKDQIFTQQPQKSHEHDILPKNLQIDLSFFAPLGIFMHQGHRMQR